MVGFVIVSHSRTLADGVVELTSMMADGVPIRAAGGLDDGSFGTSYEKIANAIDEIYSDDGVIVLMDMGSAVMTAEMVLESMPERKLVLADCPLVEGAVAATVSAIAGSSLEEILDELQDVRELKKLSYHKQPPALRAGGRVLQGVSMKEFQYTIQDPMGFHARPAGALVRAAKAYESRITIACGERSAQLTRLMAVMALGIKQGQTVTVTIDGPDEDRALEDLQAQFRANA